MDRSVLTVPTIGRKGLAILVGVGMLVSIAGMASPTGATPPSTETITITRDKPGGVPAGWTASGLFSDSGSNPGWTQDRLICGACPSPVAFAGIFFETATSDTSGDTINLRYVLAANTQGENDLCYIEGGTGGYTNLRGQGTFTFVNNGPTSPVDIVCTAQVQMS